MKAAFDHAVLTDFGSTYTKVAAVDLARGEILLSARFPSTVHTDARIGLSMCFDAARKVLGEQKFLAAVKLSSSSAAGGLRMGVIGLSHTLSLRAGENAAFGAGAKILRTFSGRLKREDVEELEKLPLEILLFLGGYENGSRAALLHNAGMLAASDLHIPVIYAGNSAVSREVRQELIRGNKECYIVPNIIPGVGQLEKEAAEEIIRDIFLKRIINMKGLDRVSGMLDRMVMPTPAAVLSAGELLSRGTASQAGLGPLMIVDIGGATTDIHSFADQVPYEGARIIGSPEPYGIRTVEADLGMRESSGTLLKAIREGRAGGRQEAAPEGAEEVVQKWLLDHDALAETEAERSADLFLARGACRIAARRHAGWLEPVHSAGVKNIQKGKNLTSVRTVIGTGGPLIFGGRAGEILGEICRKPGEENRLLPGKIETYLDADYVLFAGGLLREIDDDIALTVMKKSLTPFG